MVGGIQVFRGSYVESTHAFSACIARADGESIYALGDVEHAYPLSSLTNPFLAAEFIRSGAADAFGAQDIELALAAGSHDGEERHIASLRAFLERMGLTEDYLLCGPSMLGRLVVGPPVAHHCSGKHAALLALCRHLSLSCDDYTETQHPIQERLLPQIYGAFGVSLESAPLATDGCSMPVFGASLQQIAAAYARFGVSNDDATVRVRDAMIAEPGYTGGWFGNLDTRVITWSRGAILSKSSTEGLHASSIPESGFGIAVKIHDGNARALPPVLAHLLTNLLENVPLPPKHIAELEIPPVVSASGHRVGEVRANGIPSFRELLVSDRR